MSLNGNYDENRTQNWAMRYTTRNSSRWDCPNITHMFAYVQLLTLPLDLLVENSVLNEGWQEDVIMYQSFCKALE